MSFALGAGAVLIDILSHIKRMMKSKPCFVFLSLVKSTETFPTGVYVCAQHTDVGMNAFAFQCCCVSFHMAFGYYTSASAM